MSKKSLWLLFASGLVLLVGCLGWFLEGLGNGGGEAPIAGMVIGLILIVGTLIAGLVKVISGRSDKG